MIQECKELHCTKMTDATHCTEHRKQDIMILEEEEEEEEQCKICNNERVLCPGCSTNLLEELQTSKCGVMMRCPVCVGYGEALYDKKYAESNPTATAKEEHELLVINCLRYKFPLEKEWKQVMNCESDSDSDSDDPRTECEYTGCTKVTANANELCPDHNHPCRECEADGAELYQGNYYCEGCVLEVKRARAPTPTPTAKRKVEFKEEPENNNKRKPLQELKELSNKRPRTEQQEYEEKVKRLQIQLYPPNQQGDPQIRPANGKFKSNKRSLKELDEWEQEIARASNSMKSAKSVEDEKFILRHLMSRASFLAKKKKDC